MEEELKKLNVNVMMDIQDQIAVYQAIQHLLQLHHLDALQILIVVD